jgi:hypothetical protein
MTRPTPEYQRLVRQRYKRNPKHAEVQAVLRLWGLATEDESKWQAKCRKSARLTSKDSEP